MSVHPRIRSIIFVALLPISFVVMALWGASLGVGNGVRAFAADLREAKRLLKGGAS